MDSSLASGSTVVLPVGAVVAYEKLDFITGENVTCGNADNRALRSSTAKAHEGGKRRHEECGALWSWSLGTVVHHNTDDRYCTVVPWVCEPWGDFATHATVSEAILEELQRVNKRNKIARQNLLEEEQNVLRCAAGRRGRTSVSVYEAWVPYRQGISDEMRCCVANIKDCCAKTRALYRELQCVRKRSAPSSSEAIETSARRYTQSCNKSSAVNILASSVIKTVLVDSDTRSCILTAEEISSIERRARSLRHDLEEKLIGHTEQFYKAAAELHSLRAFTKELERRMTLSADLFSVELRQCGSWMTGEEHTKSVDPANDNSVAVMRQLCTETEEEVSRLSSMSTLLDEELEGAIHEQYGPTTSTCHRVNFHWPGAAELIEKKPEELRAVFEMELFSCLRAADSSISSTIFSKSADGLTVMFTFTHSAKWTANDVDTKLRAYSFPLMERLHHRAAGPKRGLDLAMEEVSRVLGVSFSKGGGLLYEEFIGQLPELLRTGDRDAYESEIGSLLVHLDRLNGENRALQHALHCSTTEFKKQTADGQQEQERLRERSDNLGKEIHRLNEVIAKLQSIVSKKDSFMESCRVQTVHIQHLRSRHVRGATEVQGEFEDSVSHEEYIEQKAQVQDLKERINNEIQNRTALEKTIAEKEYIYEHQLHRLNEHNVVLESRAREDASCVRDLRRRVCELEENVGFLGSDCAQKDTVIQSMSGVLDSAVVRLEELCTAVAGGVELRTVSRECASRPVPLRHRSCDDAWDGRERLDAALVSLRTCVDALRRDHADEIQRTAAEHDARMKLVDAELRAHREVRVRRLVARQENAELLCGYVSRVAPPSIEERVRPAGLLAEPVYCVTIDELHDCQRTHSQSSDQHRREVDILEREIQQLNTKLENKAVQHQQAEAQLLNKCRELQSIVDSSKCELPKEVDVVEREFVEAIISAKALNEENTKLKAAIRQGEKEIDSLMKKLRFIHNTAQAALKRTNSTIEKEADVITIIQKLQKVAELYDAEAKGEAKQREEVEQQHNEINLKYKQLLNEYSKLENEQNQQIIKYKENQRNGEEKINKIQKECTQMALRNTKLERDVAQRDAECSGLSSDLVHSQSVVAQLERELNERTKAVAQLERELNERAKAVAQLERELNERDKAVAQLERDVAQRDAECSGLSSDLVHSQSVVAQLERELNVRTKAVAQLERELNVRTKAIPQLERELNERAKAVAQLERELNERTKAVAQLERDVAQRDAECSGLSSDLVHSQSVVAQLERELNERAKAVAQLERELNERAKAVAQLERELNERAKAVAQLERDVAQRDAECSGLSSDLVHSQSVVAQLERELNERTKAVAQLERELNERTKAVAQLERELNERAKAVAQLERELNERTKAVAQLERELNERDKAVAQLERDVAQRDAECSGLSSDLVHSQSVVAQLERELNERTKAVAQLERDVAQRDAECSGLSSDLVHSQSVVAQLERELNVRTKAVAQLERELNVRTKAIPQLERELNERAKAVAQLERDVAQRDAECSGLSSDLVHSQSVVAQLERELNERTKAVAQLERDVAQRDAECSGLSSDLVHSQSVVAQLERELNERAKAVAQLERELNERTKAVAQLERELNERAKAVAQLERELNERAKAVAQLERELNERTKAVAQLERDVAQRDAECSGLSSDLVHSQSVVAQLERELNERAKAVAQLERELNERTKAVAQLERDVAQRDAECSGLSSDLVHSQSVVAQLERELNERTKAVAQLERELNERTKAVAQLERELNERAKAVAQLERDVAQRDAECSGLSSDLVHSQSVVAQLERELNERTKAVAQLERDVAQRDAECSGLSSDLVHSQSVVAQLERELNERAKAVAQLERELNERTKAVAQLERDVAQRDAECSGLSSDLVHSQSVVAQLERELNERTKAVAQLERELNERTKAVAQLERELNERTKAVAQLERELNERAKAVAQLERELNERAKAVAQLERELNERTKAVAQLERELNERTKSVQLFESELFHSKSSLCEVSAKFSSQCDALRDEVTIYRDKNVVLESRAREDASCVRDLRRRVCELEENVGFLGSDCAQKDTVIQSMSGVLDSAVVRLEELCTAVAGGVELRTVSRECASRPVPLRHRSCDDAWDGRERLDAALVSLRTCVDALRRDHADEIQRTAAEHDARMKLVDAELRAHREVRVRRLVAREENAELLCGYVSRVAPPSIEERVRPAALLAEPVYCVTIDELHDLCNRFEVKKDSLVDKGVVDKLLAEVTAFREKRLLALGIRRGDSRLSSSVLGLSKRTTVSDAVLPEVVSGEPKYCVTLEELDEQRRLVDVLERKVQDLRARLEEQSVVTQHEVSHVTLLYKALEERYDCKCSEHVSCVQVLKSELDSLRSRLEDVQANNLLLNRHEDELASARLRCTRLQEAVSSREDEMRALEQHLAELVEELAERRKEVLLLIGQLDEVVGKVEAAREEERAAVEQLAGRDTEICELQQTLRYEHERYEKALLILQEQLDSVRSQREEDKSVHLWLKGDYERLREELSMSERALEAREEEIEKLQDRLRSYEALEVRSDELRGIVRVEHESYSLTEITMRKSPTVNACPGEGLDELLRLRVALEQASADREQREREVKQLRQGMELLMGALNKNVGTFGSTSRTLFEAGTSLKEMDGSVFAP